MATYRMCEPSWATPTSRVHVRLVGPEGVKPGGGIPTSALCTADLAKGWDLPGEISTDRLRRGLGAEYGPTCAACLAVWVKRP